MPKINEYLNINRKPVEIVYELKDYEIKKSPLSLAAQNKVINKSGNNFSSEKEGYGPCEYYSCPYSTRFHLKIGFSGRDIKFCGRDETGDYGCNIYWITMENIERARNVLRKFEKGNANTNNSECYYVVECTSLFGDSEWSSSTRNAQKKQAEIMLEIKNCIDSHERGNEVYKTLVDFNRNDGDCSVIM